MSFLSQRFLCSLLLLAFGIGAAGCVVNLGRINPSTTQANRPAPEVACAIQEEMFMVYMPAQSGYTTDPQYVYFQLDRVDGRNVLALRQGGGPLIFGSAGTVPPTPTQLAPLEVEAGVRRLRFICSGKLVPLPDPWRLSPTPNLQEVRYIAFVECEVELEQGKTYLAYGQMAGAAVQDGFVFTLEEASTRTRIYNNPSVPVSM